VDDKFVKVIAYYDNEWAYAARLLELCLFVDSVDKDFNKRNVSLLLPGQPCPMMSSN